MASLSNQIVSQEHSEASTLPAKSQGDGSNSNNASFDIENPTPQDRKAQHIADSPMTKEDPNLITWSGPNDPANPQNWPFDRKLGITAIWVWANMVTTTASSIFSSGAEQVVEEFHVSSNIAVLGVSLFLLGYAVGPPIWGPMSERFGRKWPLFIATSCFTFFCLPVTLGQNIQTVLIGRFFCGVFGSAPLSIVGGGIVDIWDPVSRGVALASCIGAIFGTPILGPIMGNFVAASYLRWRWDNWVSAIMGLSCSIIVLLFLPETFAVVILKKKAEHVRRNTGNVEAKCIFDEEKKDLKTIMRVYLVRPFIMLALEPILSLVTIYQAFTYGILYLVFVSYPIAFREVRHWSLGISGLAYLGMLTGVFLGAALVIAHTKTRFAQITKANNDIVIPEQRLPLMILGGCLLPAGLFVYAWTSDPDIHWTGQIIGSIPIGTGLYMVFVQCINYIVDVYYPVANSAVSANAFVRSFFGASFPLFGPAMYHHLGVAWATSLLAFISIAMIPIPILFYVYGQKIRSWSRMTVKSE